MPKKVRSSNRKASDKGSNTVLKLLAAYEKGYKDALKEAEKIKKQLTSKLKKVIAKKRTSAKRKTRSTAGRGKFTKRRTSYARKSSLRRKTSMRRHRRAA